MTSLIENSNLNWIFVLTFAVIVLVTIVKELMIIEKLSILKFENKQHDCYQKHHQKTGEIMENRPRHGYIFSLKGSVCANESGREALSFSKIPTDKKMQGLPNPLLPQICAQKNGRGRPCIVAEVPK